MNILIADNHPAITEGYRVILSKGIVAEAEIYFSTCLSCQEVFETINSAKLQNKRFTLAILDYSIPPFHEKKLSNSGDLVAFIKREMPDCKCVIITGCAETITLFDIIQKGNPDGIALKGDITPETLCFVLNQVIKNEKYQSPSVKKAVQEIWEKQLFAQQINRQILIHLSNGYRIKDIEHEMELSASAIQKRIAKMKQAFSIGNDSNLVRKAREEGYI